MGCDFPLCWAYAKTGYSLAEHAQRLLSRWLSMLENWLLIGWAELICWLSIWNHVHFQSFSSGHPLLCSLLPSLSSVLCPLSHVCVVCTLSPVLFTLFTSLFLIFRPLYPVSRLCFLPQSSVPSLASLVSHPLSPVSYHFSCPLYPVLRSLSPTLPSLSPKPIEDMSSESFCQMCSRLSAFHVDEGTIKTPNTKCRPFWCLIEFIDWRCSQSCWCFGPSCKLLPLYLISDLPHPYPPCQSKHTVYTDSGWLWGVRGFWVVL